MPRCLKEMVPAHYDDGCGWIAAVRYRFTGICPPHLDTVTDTTVIYLPLAVRRTVLMHHSTRSPHPTSRSTPPACAVWPHRRQPPWTQPACSLLHNLVRTSLPLSNAERARLLADLDKQGEPTVMTTELTWAERVRPVKAKLAESNKASSRARPAESSKDSPIADQTSFASRAP